MVLGHTLTEYKKFLVSEIQQQMDDGTDVDISVVWYCLDGAGMRLQDADLNLLSFFGEDAILVVTKCELLNKKQFGELCREIKEHFQMSRVVITSSTMHMGLERLIERTFSNIAAKMPFDQQSGFVNALEKAYIKRFAHWQYSCDKKADEYIMWAAARAAALSAIPIPLTDAIPLSINEFYLFTKLFALYGHLDWKSALLSLGYPSVATLVGRFIFCRIVTTILPIPILKSAVASSTTYMMGMLLKRVARSMQKLTNDELKDTIKKARKDWKTKKELLKQIPAEPPQ